MPEPLPDTGARFAAIVESAADAIVVVDAGQRILLFNHAAARMFGRPPQDTIGGQLDQFIVPRFRPDVASALRHARADGGGTTSAFRAVTADGREFPCEASIAALGSDDQREFTLIIRDVTERARSEDALRREIEFETFLFDLSSTFIGLPDEKVDVHMAQGLARVGAFLRLDRVTLLELSADREEMVVAHSWSSHGASDAAPRISRGVQPWWIGQVLRGQVSLAARIDDLPDEAREEKEYLRQRGVASAASIPLRVGDEIAGAISFITVHRHDAWSPETVSRLRAIGHILWNARKRHQAMQARVTAEGLVRESEERFRLAMSNIAAGVYTLDTEGLVTYVNPSAEAMFGWTMSELLGRKMHDVTHYQHPDGTPFPASECPGLQVLQKGVRLREEADTFIRKDGRFFPVIYNASPLRKDGAIVGVVVGFRDDTERREAERAVRESEERFRQIFNTTPVIIWMADPTRRGTYINDAWTTLTGLPPESAHDERWATMVHPDDIARCLEVARVGYERRERFDVEYRVKSRRGDYRWLFAQGVPRFDADGSFAGYVGSAVDVTERKEAEELLSTLSQRLIQAQEQERARVARELHDDISQRLALLVLSLETVRYRLRSAAPDLTQEIAEAIETATTLSGDVHNLSHRLHSARLQTMGLELAARETCRELSERSRVAIEFQSEGTVAGLSEAVSVCLYRVLQEALQNAIKHSGAPSIAVSLTADATAVTLTVRDSGNGFEPGKALKGRGLGLVSMKERLKLVDGRLTIDAQPQAGTTLRARVPLGGERSATS